MTPSGIVPIFLHVHPRDIAVAKFVFESYEGVGIVRTLNRRQAIIVVLAVTDFEATARGIIESLRDLIDIEEVAAPPDAGDDWLLASLLPVT